MRKSIVIISVASTIIVTALIIIYFLYSSIFSNTTQNISQLNNEVRTLLSAKYRLTISDDIIFVDGHYDNAFQDNSVYLTLRVPHDSLSSFYDANHYKDTSSPGDKDSDGVTIQKRLEYEGELYTYINIYSSEDGYTLVKFTGRYPGSRPGV